MFCKELCFMLFLVNLATAQTTAVPDENFEQALVDLDIDSDGVVNGQVLTSDISDIIELNFTNLYDPLDNGLMITDFTGIEDFTALEILNLSNAWVELSEEQASVFNSNLNLREFRADDSSFDTSPLISIPYLELNNLNNLELISLISNNGDTHLNLNNPNSTLVNLTIDLSHEYWYPGYNRTVCINVSDPQAAADNDYPYDTWNIITPEPDVNGYTYVLYNFSSNCYLSTSDFDLQTKIKVYPNPVKDILKIENLGQIKIDAIELYSINGQRIKTFSKIDHSINLESLNSGLYFIKFITGDKSHFIKVLKSE